MATVSCVKDSRFTAGSAELGKIEVEHGRELVDNLRSKKGFLYVGGEVVEEIDGLVSQCEVGPHLNCTENKLTPPVQPAAQNKT